MKNVGSKIVFRPVMASNEARKKLTKSERKKLLSERGRIGAETRGLGVGSRQDLVLPAQWETENHVYPSHVARKVISPGKTRYHNAEKVRETLKKRKMDLCVSGASQSSEEQSDSDSDSYKDDVTESVESVVDSVVERQLFVCESSGITALIDDINRCSRCSTIDCNGVLVPTKIDVVGLGGTINITFQCNGCKLRNVNFNGSSLVEGSRRTVVGLALAVAFVVAGHGFSKFKRTLNDCLGIPALSKNRYFDVIKLIHPCISEILNKMCEEEKEKMKKIGCETLGSWHRAVVTSDGVWQTRGHFSKNGSFIIKNYLTGGILWFGHKCMKGNDNDDLYMGTSKSMEGALADESYKQAKDEGCGIEVVWQDADSSSQKSMEDVFGEMPRRVFKCGGHVGRAHGNNLKELAKLKQFSATQIAKLKTKFPDAAKVTCWCKRHSKSCGCLSEQFIKSSRINHFCCLQQCKTAEEYARRMRVLGEYHCTDVHSWEGGECGFHSTTICSCGECEDNEHHTCEGKAYTTKNVLKCPFHRLAYQTECELRAKDAEAVIHPEMGRGNSNLCEAHFSVLPNFRAKDQNLQRLHYITSTNCGLVQGNMTWCFENRGEEYHWIVDLYERLKLPVLPTVVSALRNVTAERMADLKKRKTEESKRKRISQKVARAEEQEERKRWGKRQAIQHSYGDEDLHNDVEEEDGDKGTKEAEESGMKCRCGSSSHKRTSHRLCPLNKKNSESTV